MKKKDAVFVPIIISLSIIIPVFNEEKNIFSLFNDITVALAGIEYEIIIVDDCSELLGTIC